MNRISRILLPILCTGLLFSCKKEEEGDNTYMTIVNGRWVITADTFFTGAGAQEVYQNSLNCSKDDYNVFWNSGQYFYDRGVLKCDTSTVQRTEDGVWTYNTTDSVLFISGGPLAGPFRLKRIDENEMTLWRDNTTFDGSPASRHLKLTSIN
jgi:hypothetical protein